MLTVVFALCGFLRNKTMMMLTMMAMMQVDNQKKKTEARAAGASGMRLICGMS